jgi:hypothetical protein
MIVVALLLAIAGLLAVTFVGGLPASRPKR